MQHPFSSKIPVNAHSEKLLKPIRAAAEAYLGTPIASLPYTLYKSFWETGNRVAYEDKYVEHRRRLNVFTAMALSSDEDKWLAELENAIWAVCDEFTWALPAHVYGREKTPAPEHTRTVDLFASETAFALSEIYSILYDRLAPLVKQRMYEEIKRRVIDPYMENNLTWGKNNWSAVCAGSVGSAMMLLGMDDTFAQAKQRLLSSMDYFLDSYRDDGCCLEGVLYWGYGFGYFCFFAALLRDYTNGEIDLFKNEKVHQIALFRQRGTLKGNVILPFADATHTYNCNIGLSHFLAREYPDVTVSDVNYEVMLDDEKRYRMASFLRDFYWYDESLPACEETKDETFFGEASQWFIKREHGCVYACKGGCNNEPHNHNDVGGFILFDGKGFVIDDLGWNEYVDGYFGERRYDFLCTSSRGHSVPIVNGQYQQAGEQYAAKVLAHDEQSCTLELVGAYDVAELTSLVRNFAVKDDGVLLTDTVCGDGVQVTERFVTRMVPTVTGNTVQVGDYEIYCDTAAEVAVSSEQFAPRLNIQKTDMKPIETAYLIDFTVAPVNGQQTLRFHIQKVS